MQKIFTKAEKEMLLEKSRNYQMAKALLDECVNFLHKQYATTPQTAQIMPDGSGFTLIEPKPVVKTKA